MRVRGLLCSAFLAFSQMAFAADGDLDATYASGGIALTSFGVSDNVYGGVLQPDGKLIVIGGARPSTNQEMSAVRYNTNGSIDTSFASAGKYSLDITPATTTDRGTCGGIQSDGKIIIGGYTRIGSGNDDFAIIRLTSAGVLDTTFGVNGIAKVDFLARTDRAADLVILPDDRIALAGLTLEADGIDSNIGVAMLTANGSLDTSFSGDGKQVIDVGDQQDDGRGITVQSDGKLLVSGFGASNGGAFLPVIARLNTNGSMDTSFGTGGVFSSSLGTSTNDFFEDLQVQSDGKIVAAGRTAPGASFAGVIARLTSTGSLDTSFNSTGFRVVEFGTLSDSYQDVLIQADGKILVGGYWQNTSNNNLDSVMTRVLSTGALDTTFGSGGNKLQSLGAGSDRIEAIFLDSSNRILAAAESNATNGLEDFAAARFVNTVAVVNPSASIAVSPGSVLEDGSGNLVYTVTLSSAATSTTTVNISTGGSATSGSDFVGALSSVSISAGSSSASITINPTTDTTVEANETVILTVSSGSGYTVGTPSSATGTITNDDFPSASISVSPSSVLEDGSGNLLYTIQLSDPAPSSTTINLTIGGTATGGDYVGAVAGINIGVGSSSAVVTINPTSDAAIEADETVIVSLASGTGYSIGTPNSATGIITNDDFPSASITVNTGSVLEDGSANLVYTVSLSSAATSATSVNIGTSGTATSGNDYVGAVSSVLIASGSSSGTITINPSADTNVEANETVILTINSGSGYSVGTPSAATGTITNDDFPFAAISVSPLSTPENGTGNLLYTIQLSDPAPSTTTVNLTTAGTATTAVDYTGAVASVTISAGNSSALVTINPTSDTTVEADETVIVSLAAGTGYSLGSPNSATGTITNDDFPSASITVSPSSVLEDGVDNLVYTVALSVPAISATTVNIGTGGTATSGSDFSGAVASVLIGAGNTTGSVTIDPSADGNIETDETVVLTLLAGTGYTVGAPSAATGTISNDDFPSASISVSPSSVLEDSGSSLIYSVNLSSPAPVATTINLASSGTASSGSDYIGAPSSVLIAAGGSSGTISITPSADSVVENNETVILTITSGTAYTLGTPVSATGTIIDDDLPIASIAVSPSSVLEDGVANLLYTVSLNTPALTSTTVNLSISGSASSPSDFAGAVTSVIIPAGSSSAAITIDPSADTQIEADETVIFALAAGSGYAIGTPNSATGSINNDDFPAVSISVSPSSVLEDGANTLSYLVSLNQAALNDLSVNLSLGGTATSGSDYSGASSTLLVSAGSLSGTLVLDPSADAVVEANETIIVGVLAGSGYTVGSPNSATASITNDDIAGVVLTQSGGATAVTEGGNDDSYTLVLTSEPSANVVIAINSGTQLVTPTSLTFTAANWSEPQTVSVQAVDDAAVEGPHTGTISHLVSSSDANYNGTAIAEVVVQITDNDAPSLSVNDVSVVEGNNGLSTLSFTVTRTGATPFPVSFNYATADASAQLVDGDYQALSGTATIPSGGSSATTNLSVSIVGDEFFENDETLVMNLSAPQNATIADAQGIGSLSNDDQTPVLSLANASLVEGNSGNQVMAFTLTRTGLTKLPATVGFASANDSAVAPGDYTAASGTVTVPADAQSAATATINISVIGETSIEADEVFRINLTNPSNATLASSQASGTIINDDGPPSFTPGPAISLTQGSPSAVVNLGSVSDITDPAGSLTVALQSTTTTGISTTGLSNSAGAVTANMTAACTATAGSVRLRVTDSGGLSDEDDVQVLVLPNTPPSLAYSGIAVAVGASITQAPSQGPSDNGSVSSVAIQSQGTYAGGISISSAGVLTLTNATPAGSHTVIVRALDQCGANTDASVTITIAQAATIKDLTSNVSPSRFGQAITFSAQVAGVNPTGSVEFFDGSTSLGSATLLPSPSGGDNLKLASLVVTALNPGTHMVTANYLGDVNNAPASSPALIQGVIAADTAVSISTVASSASTGPSVIGVQVQALAPGAGIVTGSVQLSAGPGNSCVATLSAGAGSCTLNFATPGFYSITGLYVPSNGNFAGSTGAAALVVLANPSSSDVRVRIGNGQRNIQTGQMLRYEIIVDNLGSQAVVARVQVPLSADLSGASFSCISTAQSDCGPNGFGIGSIDRELSLAPGGVVIYQLNALAPINPERLINQSANVSLVAGSTDPDLSNNSAIDEDPMGLLADGFENIDANE